MEGILQDVFHHAAMPVVWAGIPTIVTIAGIVLKQFVSHAFLQQSQRRFRISRARVGYERNHHRATKTSTLMNCEKYIGLDVHQATISAAVMDSMCKSIMESILETKASTILEFLVGLRGTLSVTFEEGTWGRPPLSSSSIPTTSLRRSYLRSSPSARFSKRPPDAMIIPISPRCRLQPSGKGVYDYLPNRRSTHNRPAICSRLQRERTCVIAATSCQ
jgi:hypothetical protein